MPDKIARMFRLISFLLVSVLVVQSQTPDRVTQLLKELTDAPGPPGYEDPVRKLMAEKMRPMADHVSYDGLGSVIAQQGSIGPRIMLDAERCILCTRCIRFTRDIAGDDALGIINRGSFNTIATFPGMPFDNNYTLNTVDICSVGALRSRCNRRRKLAVFET